MPIYSYQCLNCGNRFERLRPMSSVTDDIPPACPVCESAETRRVVSGFAVHGPAGPDHEEIAAQRAHDERMASITSKETIDSLRASKKRGA